MGLLLFLLFTFGQSTISYHTDKNTGRKWEERYAKKMYSTLTKSTLSDFTAVAYEDAMLGTNIPLECLNC